MRKSAGISIIALLTSFILLSFFNTAISAKEYSEDIKLSYRRSAEGYIVDPDNPYFSSYKGMIYTKDYEKLLLCPRDKKEFIFHENMKIIGSNSLHIGSSEGGLVIPWGVTTIEKSAIDVDGKVILPETVVTLGQQRNAYWNIFLFPKCNKAACAAFDDTHRSVKLYNYEYHWYDYYGLRPNEWKTINGKRYYFTKSEGWFYGDPAYSYETEPHMVTGWWRIDGTAYYFDETGAMAQECWKEIDGKWTRFDEDGGVKKGFWISIAAWFRGLWS